MLPAQMVSAATPDECDALVFDQTGTLEQNRQLQDAVSASTRAGALVRVRSYDSVPDGDLDAYIEALEAECPSWRAPDGGRRSNLLVLAVAAADRTTGTYFGSAYDDALAAQWPRIQADVMNPRFRDGDYGLGLAEGLTEATRLIEEARNPGLANDAPASDSGGLGSILLPLLVGLLVLAGLGLAATFVIRHLRRRRGEQESVAAARARAQDAYEEAAAAFITVDRNVHEAADQVAAVTAFVSDEDDAHLQADMAAAQASVDAASTRWIAAQERWGTGALGKADPNQSKAARATLGSITQDLREADALVAAASARASSFLASADALPAQLRQARDAVNEASAALAAATAAGLDVSSGTASMANASTELDRAAEMIEGRRIGAAASTIASVLDRAQSLSRGSVELPGDLDAARAGVDGVAEEAAKRRAAQPAALAVLGELIATYGSASVAAVDGPVRAMAERLDDVDTAIAEGRSALDLRSFEGLERAGSCTASAGAALSDVDTALAALEELRRDLSALAVELPGRLSALDDAVSQTRAYLVAHADDLDSSRVVELDAITGDVRSLAAQLAAPHSNLPQISVQREAAEASLLALTTAVTNDVRAAEESRTRAADAVAKAKADLDASEVALARYGRDNSARASLQKARGLLSDAQASTDLAAVLALAVQASAEAERAERSARQAHEQAQADAERAERAERDAREDRDRDRDAGGGGGSSSWGDGGGGGGSSKW